METIKNVAQILVVDDTIASGTVADVTAGDLGILKVTTNALVTNYAALSSGDKYKFVTKTTGGNILLSDVLVKGSEVSAVKTDYSASTGIIDYIGYNGTSGSIDAINSNIYTVRLYIKDNTTASFMRDLVKEGYYKSDSNATQAEVAVGLVRSLVANFTRDEEVKGLVSFSAIANQAVTSDNALDNDATVTKGSKWISVATAVTYDTGTALAVGDFLRIGDNSGTALTDSVYKVEEISGLNVRLSHPVLEASGTYATSTDDVEVIPAADVATANFGIRIVGLKKTFVPGVFNSSPYVFWDLNLQDAGSTPTSRSQGVSLGIGTYEWVAEREFEWAMNGYPYRMTYPKVDYDLQASTSVTGYDILAIAFKDEMDTTLGTQADSPKQLYIASVESNTTEFNSFISGLV